MKIKRLFGLLIASIWAVSAHGQVSDLEKLKQEGRDLFDMEKYHEALTKFNEVLKISPNEQEALYEKAYCLSKLNANREATEIIEGSIKRGEGKYSLLNEYNLLGMLYSDEGRQLEAIDCYEKAATFLNSASNTIQAKVYYNLADQLFSLSAENREKRKDWEDEALRYSHLAISCSPNCGPAYYIVGNIISNMGAFHQALSAYLMYALYNSDAPRYIEDDLATWKSMGLKMESGDRSIITFNIVKELMQNKPSEYGKLYDIFSAAFEVSMNDSTDIPIPVSYSYDIWGQSIFPLIAELSRKGLLECFLHLTLANTRNDKGVMANDQWLMEHEEKYKELGNYLSELRIFNSNLRMGFIPEPFDFKTAEEAHKHITDVMGCCQYYIEHLSDDPKMGEARKYITSWSAVASDVNIKIGPTEAKLFSRHPEFQAYYHAACLFYALMHNEKTFTKNAYTGGLYVIIGVYNRLKELKRIANDEELEKLCDISKNDKDSFNKYVEENYNKIH